MVSRIQSLPEVVIGIVRLQMNIFDMLTMGSMDRDRCSLYHGGIAILFVDEFKGVIDLQKKLTSHGYERTSCKEP